MDLPSRPPRLRLPVQVRSLSPINGHPRQQGMGGKCSTSHRQTTLHQVKQHLRIAATDEAKSETRFRSFYEVEAKAGFYIGHPSWTLSI
jgi:hypothetical protein